MRRTPRWRNERQRGGMLRSVQDGRSLHLYLLAGIEQVTVSDAWDPSVVASGIVESAHDPPCQDHWVVSIPFIEEYPSAVAGVFDGHGVGGHQISRFVAGELIDKQLRRLLKALQPGDALLQAFENTDLALADASFLPVDSSGTTASVLIVYFDRVYCGFVGDSRCVLGRSNRIGGFECIELSADHKPDRESEYQRIIACGGQVLDISGAPPRVWNRGSKTSPGLAVSRSFGDFSLRCAGVSSIPEITSYTLHAEDSFIIMASDGVWGVFESDDVVSFIGERRRRGSAQKVAEAVVSEATRRWLGTGDGDDITCVLIFLDGTLDTGSSALERSGKNP
mmetsp:Transcript_17060/g.35496  ORF Transcript_17060/g.35496 Transcript_17060/m.35496 type:complete len:337 (-) Transcript_17060:1054-2064(-)